MDVVVFRSGPRTFGIPVERVAQVFAVVEIAPLAGAPVPVRGVVDIHGSLTPVVDLGRRFAESWSELQLDGRLIYVDAAARPLLVLADDVDGVRSVDASEVADPGELLTAAETAALETALRHA
jgi:purine-binding chemotaxis protein CheW